MNEAIVNIWEINPNLSKPLRSEPEIVPADNQTRLFRAHNSDLYLHVTNKPDYAEVSIAYGKAHKIISSLFSINEITSEFNAKLTAGKILIFTNTTPHLGTEDPIESHISVYRPSLRDKLLKKASLVIKPNEKHHYWQIGFESRFKKK